MVAEECFQVDEVGHLEAEDKVKKVLGLGNVVLEHQALLHQFHAYPT